ncbi:C40 family peptidase [Actinomadura sp. SCN-SB]|uniref:C40 family peptidase n=1 Tax=Actinomadura sp. SCN-SB TaxID=3373092 RepID=UPI00375279C1
MFERSSRALPLLIGTSTLATLSVGLAFVVGPPADPPAAPERVLPGRFLAAPQSPQSSDGIVAPLKERLTPHLLVSAPSSLPQDVVAKVRALKDVRAAEVADAARTAFAGSRVGLLGIDPSTFRNYTPRPTAQSDALWRNVAAGDIAVSFTLGTDGAVRLGSQTPIGGTGSRPQRTIRVGALATMGISDVDAVVSRDTARELGLPTGNALLISARSSDPGSLTSRLRKLLPRQAKIVGLAGLDERTGASVGQLPDARGQVLTARQTRVAIQAAMSKLGMPYVWGGESDAEGGYDCSGILQYAFGKAGVRLPRVAADQARTGRAVPFGEARPGDLLTWAHDPTAPGYISHIALYLGKGRMLAAPRRGTFVRVQPVYFVNFKGAIRINPRLAARLAG